MKKLLLLSSILFAQTSWGTATEFGNGGNAVICPKENGKSVSAYDATEAVLRYDFQPFYAPSENSQCYTLKNGRKACNTGTEIARDVLTRLAVLDLDLMSDLNEKLDNFWSETTLIHAELNPVNDQGLSFIPDGCSVKQLAIQQEPIFAEDSRYFISAPLWNLMPEHDRAVLILHEIIYRYALEHSASTKNSVPVRYFNALLISDRFRNFSVEKYREIYFQVFRINQEPEP